MPEEKRPLKVFLCHAHSEPEAVRAIYDSPDRGRGGCMARQGKAAPRAGLGVGNSQGCARSGCGGRLPFKAIQPSGISTKGRCALPSIQRWKNPKARFSSSQHSWKNVIRLKAYEDGIGWICLKMCGYESLTQALNLRSQQVGAISFSSPILKLKPSIHFSRASGYVI